MARVATKNKDGAPTIMARQRVVVEIENLKAGCFFIPKALDEIVTEVPAGMALQSLGEEVHKTAASVLD